MTHARRLAALATILFVTLGAGADASRTALTVIAAGPNGEVAYLSDTAEIRVEFSEPMVPLGRASAGVTAPFFEISPAVRGTFRWAGTTTLIFTPAAPLPFATQYTVRITTAAVSVSGSKLATPFTFTFTTPTVRLLGAEWYRESGRVDEAVFIGLLFNQPVTPAVAARHIAITYAPHEWSAPEYPDAALARLRATAPDALAAFERKKAATAAVARRDGVIGATPTTAWDTDRFPASDRLVVLKTTTAPPPESWINVTVASGVRGRGGAAQPRNPQSFTLELERAFFIEGFECHSQCDPSGWNPMKMRAAVEVSAASSALTVRDITSAASPRAVERVSTPRHEDDAEPSTTVTLEDAGFAAQPPARTFAVTVAPTLRAADGQTLGYAWLGVVEHWHAGAFTSFGDGHGVWEKDGGKALPFSARNILNVTQWVQRLSVGDLMGRVLAIARDGGKVPPDVPGQARSLNVAPDQVQAHGLDLRAALDADGTGLVWAAIRDGAPLARAKPITPGATKSTLVQVTNLGITVKDAPGGTLVFVTRLDNAAPVAGATVSLIGTNEKVAWRGATGADGVAMAPVGLRETGRPWQLSFIAVAEKDGDVAYAASDWNEGVAPWEFGLSYETPPIAGTVRGTVFTDRGVYRPGETLHLKTIVRRATGSGISLLPAGTAVVAVTRDSRSREIDRRTLTLNRWSSAEWTFAVPNAGALGTYFVSVETPVPASAPATAEDGERDSSYLRRVHGSFLVAAYRRPDFSVDASLDAPGAGPALAGGVLSASVSARYLFGAAMNARPVRWSVTRQPAFEAPAAVYERHPARLWTFVGYREGVRREQAPIRSSEQPLSATGTLSTQVDTERGAGLPYVYAFEAEVEDVSRQRLAGRASTLVHPAPWYLGIRQTNTLVSAGRPLATAVVAVTPSGMPVSGVPITVTLNRVQYHSVRRAEGSGFYTWESERRVTPVTSVPVVSLADPVPVSLPLAEGGSYEVVAASTDADGRVSRSEWSFYVMGPGYTAWERYDHQRIDLVPEKATWRPGESARIMIQSPWESATALVTVERERVRSHRTFALTSTQQTIDVPVTEGDIPNVYVSVLLVKGRSSQDPGRDGSDPGKPAFLLGYAELKVDDARKRLDVKVSANREEYRPASDAQVSVEVKDAAGRGTASEVTLWAVDEGVLQLTGFTAPDVLTSVYQQEVLQVMTADSRERIVSRRVLTPKGASEGGGGGDGPSDVRRDFRVLAFWLGSIETGANGRASTRVKLPESMTSYRIMAVAADSASRFGTGNATIRVSRPVTLRPVLPRFLTPGDRASIGAAITNTLSRGGTAELTIESADPALLRIESDATSRVAVAAGATVNVPFEATALAPGDARVRVAVRLNGQSDAFEIPIAIGVVAPWETTAAHGQTADRTAVPIATPANALPGAGGLRVDLASTALVGLGEGARYLVEYPYGCVEQRASRTLALMLAADLGEAFRLDGMAPADLKARAQTAIDELLTFQCDNGGFSFWPNECQSTSPYLTSYVAHVLQTAAALGYRAGAEELAPTYAYLERAIGQPEGTNPGWIPAYTAWQTFTARTLARGGRPQDSAITRLYGYVDRMPVFGLSYLADAMRASNASDGRLPELERRIRNAIRAESASAHVEELDDAELRWFWSSNVRSTAIVMAGLIERGSAGDLAPRMARYLLDVREDGRWNDTQENATALAALVAYYRAFESTAPDFAATVALGARQIASGEFRGRSTTAASTLVPLAEVLAGATGATRELVFVKTGAGTLFYGARLRYQVAPAAAEAAENGIRIERRFEPFVETGSSAAATSFAAGDLVRVVLTVTAPAERRFVAVTDPLPAGFEAVDGWFRTTARDLARQSSVEGGGDGDWYARMRRGGFDHVEKFDDRVQLFATRLGDGRHEFSYLVRATTAGTFLAAPAWAEEMYEPEVNGRTSPARITVRR
ncbi:MAG: MG2 domain-containing protein [Acidobacteriota bacterium]|nr:MG2 domain-containing protein [Acidobacteriota bacterium]